MSREIDPCKYSVANDTAVEMLYAGEIDLAIARFPESSPGLKIRKAYIEKIALMVSEKALGHLSEKEISKLHHGDITVLKEVPFLICQQGDIAYKVGISELLGAGIKPHIAMRSRAS